MRNSRYLILAALVAVAVSGSACAQNDSAATKATDTAVDKTKAGTDTVLDATKTGVDKTVAATRETTMTVADTTKSAAERTADKTKELAGKTADKTKEIAGDVATKAKDVTATTGEVITDAWITTKVSAKFVDEKSLKDSHINVDTHDHVVTLKGTVASAAGKTRAGTIARETEGVSRLVNQLVVK
jgi:hyperosmotically inducible protein